MRNLSYALFLTVIVFLANFTVSAQETELTVVDEVVAQVNDGVITLSDINREMENAIQSYIQEGKSREEAEKIIAAKKPELITSLINEQLVVQKAQDSISDAAVEAQINRHFLEIMKEQNIKTIEELYKAMEASGVQPDEVRAALRRQIMRESVDGEVYRSIYWEPSAKKVKEYYAANKAKFTTPETVGISEIFLSFAGKDTDSVRAKAKEIVAQLRKGADFEKMVMENSERLNKQETKGKAGSFDVAGLDPKIAAAIKDVKANGYTDPIEIVEGIEILRVDERSKSSSDSVFNEEAVRKAIATEKFPEARKKYMSGLRKEAYIKISDTWRPAVSPILYADDRKAETKAKSN